MIKGKGNMVIGGQHMVPSILVTGGAGYVGSHIALLLAQLGYSVIVLDSFVHHQPFNPSWATVIKADYADTAVLSHIFTTYDVQAVMHCAGFIEVGQSVKDPFAFYKNNVVKTLTLLETMLQHNVKRIIFSSTCAVYGIPIVLPLVESHHKHPISPYGKTKLMIEDIFQDAHTAYGLEYINLRYFNVAGAYPQEGLGEQHDPETHVIPLLLRACAHKKPFTVFGNDYPTPDGTAIRDYLHVRDIADAHVRAMNYLLAGNPSTSFNLGTGHGYSVKEMLKVVEHVCNTSIDVIWAARRPGDPPVLVADPSKACAILGWKPHYSDIDTIIRTAYEFYCATRN